MSWAEASSGITFHGRIIKADDTPLISVASEFRIRIKSPGAESCLLWEETQIRPMPAAERGSFTLTIGDDSLPSPAVRNVTSIINSATSLVFQLPEVFTNGPNYTGLNCASGSNYASLSLHGRVMQVAFSETAGSGLWEEIPEMKINYVPMAYQSEKLGGRSATEFLKIASYPSQAVLSNTQVDTLLGLVNGTATNYLRPSDAFLGDVTGPSTATLVSRIRGVNVVATAPTINQVLKFNGTNWVPSADDTGGALSDASYSAKGVVQGLTDEATSGIRLVSGVISLPNLITAGSAGSASLVPVISYDTKGRITSVTSAAVDDTSKLPLAGGTMSGAINMGNQNITNINSVAATNFSGRNLVLNDNDTHTVTIRTPADIIASYALTLPADDGAPGEVLTTNGAGILSWSASGAASNAFVQDGNSFAAAATLGTNDLNSLNFETNNATRMSLTADGALLLSGTSGATPASGAGTRMMWIPAKSAFRAGTVSGADWDDANIGDDSVAFGFNNEASGPYSTVSGGFNITASGDSAVAAGGNNITASGLASTVSGGSSNLASGLYATVSGGFGNSASNYGSTIGGSLNNSIGLYASVLGGSSNNAAGDYSVSSGRNMQLSAAADRTFAWGHSLIPVTITQPDAFIIYSGDVGMGNINPSSKLDISGATTVRGMAAPAVSPAGQGRIYFDSTSNKFRVSQNGAAYTDLVGAGGSGDILNNGNTNAAAITIGTNDNFGLNFETNGTTKLSIAANGEVSATGNSGAETTFTASKSLNGGSNLNNNIATSRSILSAIFAAGDQTSGYMRAHENLVLFNTTRNIFDLSGSLSQATYQASNNTVTAQTLMGSQSSAINGGFGNVNNSYGIRANVVNGASTTTNAFGGDFNVTQNDSGFFSKTISNAKAMNASVSIVGDGFVTNAYGLYVDTIQGTNKWSIYTSDVTAPVSFGSAFDMRGMAAPAVSAAGQGRIYFSTAENKFKVSQNGAAYVDLVGAGGGVSGTGTTNVIPRFTASTTLGDSAISDNGTVVSSTRPISVATGQNYQINGSRVLGIHNTDSLAVGTGANNASTTGQNTAVGFNAHNNNATGGENTAVGFSAASAIQSGSFRNTVVGSQAMAANTTGGSDNVAIGYAAGPKSGSSSVAWSVFVGGESGKNTEGGSANTFIGRRTGTTTLGTVLNNATAIGYNANVDASNSVVLGGNNVNLGISEVTAPTSKLDYQGAMTVRSIAAPAVSAAGTGRIYFDSTSNKFRVSQNGGAYADLVGAGGGSGDILNNGNSLTADVTIGTNDGFGLNLETAGSSRVQINSSGQIGVGRAPAANTRMAVQGAVVSTTNIINSGGVIDLSLSNTHLLKSPGTASLTLQNMVDGGTYTLFITDTTSQTYTFSGCTNTFFSPANSATTFRSSYTITTVVDGSDTLCFIAWSTGFN